MKYNLENFAKENFRIKRIKDVVSVTSGLLGGLVSPIATAFAINYVGKELNIPQDITSYTILFMSTVAFFEGIGQGSRIGEKIINHYYYKKSSGGKNGH